MCTGKDEVWGGSNVSCRNRGFLVVEKDCPQRETGHDFHTVAEGLVLERNDEESSKGTAQSGHTGIQITVEGRRRRARRGGRAS